MKLVKNEKGIYHVHFRTENGHRKVTTNCTSYEDAMKVVKDAKVKELELAARASKLTHATISQILAGRKITIDDAVEAWIDRLKFKRTPRTAELYGQTIRVWVKSAKVGKLAPAAISEKHIAGYVNDPDSGDKLSTRRCKLVIITQFLEFCRDSGWSLSNPAKMIAVDHSTMTHEEKEVRERKPFTELQVRNLLDATEGFWHIAISIARYTGLRIGDILQLEWATFNKPGVVTVWTDKRNRRVEIPMTTELAQAVALIPLDDARYCFPSERKRYIEGNRSGFPTHFSRLCVRLGMDGHTFHDLRATFATDCKAKGLDMPHIGKLLGHASEATTEIYVKPVK